MHPLYRIKFGYTLKWENLQARNGRHCRHSPGLGEGDWSGAEYKFRGRGRGGNTLSFELRGKIREGYVSEKRNGRGGTETSVKIACDQGKKYDVERCSSCGHRGEPIRLTNQQEGRRDNIYVEWSEKH